MRIDGTNGSSKAGGAKKTTGARKSGGVDFSSFLGETEEAGESKNSQGASEIANMNPLLMLQEVDERQAGRKHAIKKGQTAIGYLEDVRYSLLMGRMPREVVSDLQKLVNNWREQTDDPKLNDILNDIELRAAVELAKIEAGRAKKTGSRA